MMAWLPTHYDVRSSGWSGGERFVRKEIKVSPAISLPGAVVHLGSCLDILPTLADNSVDAVVTDPPYELGFMGKSWDSSGIAFNPAVWAECLRVLKPGGHLLAFGGSRTWHRIAVAIEDAGFEVRDSIAWLYGSGFPKSHNLKDEWQGWGTALKPAFEPVVVARKPLVGTVAANVLAYGTGAINIDGTRIGTETIITRGGRSGVVSGDERQGASLGMYGAHPQLNTAHSGRWPSNVMLDEYTAQLLDEQSGVTTSGAAGKKASSGFPGGGYDGDYSVPYGDTGGASRFFYVAKANKRDRNEGLDGLDKTDRGAHNQGLQNMDGGRDTFRKNFHPTVKPTDLMRQLIRLVTPPGGTVLDPFTGSGSTGKAAILEGFNFIGCELTEEYLPIIKGRLEHARQTKDSQIV